MYIDGYAENTLTFEHRTFFALICLRLSQQEARLTKQMVERLWQHMYKVQRHVFLLIWPGYRNTTSWFYIETKPQRSRTTLLIPTWVPHVWCHADRHEQTEGNVDRLLRDASVGASGERASRQSTGDVYGRYHRRVSKREAGIPIFFLLKTARKYSKRYKQILDVQIWTLLLGTKRYRSKVHCFAAPSYVYNVHAVFGTLVFKCCTQLMWATAYPSTNGVCCLCVSFRG